MLVREGNKISVVERKRKVEKVMKSKTFLQDFAEELDRYLSANKIKGCIIDMDYTFLDCKLDVRSFGKKLKDIFKDNLEDDGILNICTINPILDGDGGVGDCRIVYNKGYKDVKIDDVQKSVLSLYQDALEKIDSKKEK